MKAGLQRYRKSNATPAALLFISFLWVGFSVLGAENDRTALAQAAEAGKSGEFAALLQEKPYPNLDAKGKDGRTALHLLAANNMLSEAQALIQKSNELKKLAQDTLRKGHELSPDLAANAGGINVNARSTHRFTPIHVAARVGNTDVVRFLLSQGGSVNARDQYKRTPLHSAAELGHSGTVAALRAGGATMVPDKLNRLPIHLAAMGRHLDSAKLLAPSSSKSYDEYKDKKGLTPLHYASKRGDLSMVDLLLQWQTTDVVDSKQSTPLHLAAAGGHDPVVARLIEAGADVNAHDGEGRTPFDVARQDSIQKLLEKAVAESAESTLAVAVGDSRQTIVQLPAPVLNKMNNLNDRYWLYTPKQYDAEKTPLPLIIYLHGSSRRGIDVNEVKANGIPPLLDRDPNFPFVVVSPQALSKYRWQECWRPDDLRVLLQHLVATYRIDPGRVYLTGLSMGGYGTWATAAKYPELFAAAVPICGGGDPRLGPNYKHLPIWAFHGEADNVVSVERSKEMVGAINRAGGNAKLTTYAEVGHDSFTQTYANPELFEWLKKQRRPTEK